MFCCENLFEMLEVLFIRVPLSKENSFLDKGIQRHLAGTGTKFHMEMQSQPLSIRNQVQDRGQLKNCPLLHTAAVFGAIHFLRNH